MVPPAYKPLVWVVSDSFVYWMGQAVYLVTITICFGTTESICPSQVILFYLRTFTRR